MSVYRGSSVEICYTFWTHSWLYSAPPSWHQYSTQSQMDPTHKKCKRKKITTGIPACNMSKNITANKKVNVYCYYTHYNKIKFINVSQFPLFYMHFSKTRNTKVICFIVLNMCSLKMCPPNVFKMHISSRDTLKHSTLCENL